MRTVEEILKEACGRNLLLSALFERRTYPAHPNATPQRLGWRAAFSTWGGHRDEDEGATPAEALEEALKRARGLKGNENRPTAALEKPAVDLDDLI